VVAGDRTEAHEGLESKKAMGKQVTWIPRRESYLSLLCIVFSQEDRYPSVRKAYRSQMAVKQQSNTKENLL